MNILLVNPPPRKPNPEENFIVPPLGLAYLGAVLERNGIDVSILDSYALQQSWGEYENEIKKTKADIIGFTGMTPVIDRTMKAIRIARTYCQKIILGGAHATSNIRDSINNQDIDYVVYGEGEETIVELVKALETNSGFKDIRGLAYKNKDNEIIINPERPLIENLDALPNPAYHMLPVKKYTYPLFRNKNTLTLITSRGCPYNCIFCDKKVFGNRWRPRSPENVVNEIEELHEKYKIKSFIFYDDLFTVDDKRVTEICKLLIDKNTGVEWKCEGRVNIIQKETLNWMKKAGCKIIAYGVESGVQTNLDYLRKNTATSQITEAFRKTHEAGIETLAYFMFGIPGETYEEALKTIKFAVKLNPDYAQFALLRPWPGTELYDRAEKNNWLKEIDFVEPLGQDLTRLVALTGSMSEDEMKKAIEVAYRKFNLRSRYILKKISKIRGLNELKNYFLMGLRYLKWEIERKNRK